MNQSQVWALVLTLVGILVLVVFPWIRGFRRAQGNRRLRGIAELLQVLAVLGVFLSAWFTLLAFIGARSDWVGALAAAASLASAVACGPPIGRSLFVRMMRGRIGSVRARSICGGARWHGRT